MKLKGLHFADVDEIQEAVSDELKEVQKEEFSAAFQKLYDCTKAYIYIYIYICQWSLFSIKKKVCLRFLKKSVVQPLDRTVYVDC